MKIKCLISFFILYSHLVYAQVDIEQPPFKIVSIAAKTVFSKEKLNKDISGAISKEAVKEILWKNLALQDAEIQIRIYKGNGKYAWWIINRSKNIDKEGDWILTQSKSAENSRIYSTNELKGILKDTLAILDTLKLNLFLQDESLPIDRYYLNNSCNSVSSLQALAYKQNTIMIVQQKTTDCPNGYIHIRLHNGLSPQMFLGECELVFLNNDIKATLKELAISMKETDKNLDLKDIVNYINGYIEKNYGKVSRYDVTKLLADIPELKR